MVFKQVCSVDIYLESHWGLSNSLLGQIGSKLLVVAACLQIQKSNSSPTLDHPHDADYEEDADADDADGADDAGDEKDADDEESLLSQS